MKFNLTDIQTADDWQQAMAMLLAIKPVFQPVVADAPATPPVADARARKANGAAKPAQQETEPVATEPTVSEPLAKTESEEAAREKLRLLAVERGVAWFRDLLATYGATRLGDLTATQVEDALNAT